MPPETKKTAQRTLPGAAAAAKEITKKKRKELEAEQLRGHLSKTTSSERGERGDIVVTGYLSLVPEHQFRRAEIAELCGHGIVLCPTGGTTPEVHCHLKQVTLSDSNPKSSEPSVAITVAGGRALDRLLSKDVDIYEVDDDADELEVPADEGDEEEL